MNKTHVSAVVAILLVLVTLTSPGASAHCDGMDGPVVTAARDALNTGDVARALIWVQEADEAEIKSAFDRTLAVRQLNPQAKELADLYFFEALVRVHRAGEGAPYTGLKPPGRDLGPAIPAADKALQDGLPDAPVRLLTHAAEHGVRQRFVAASAKKSFKRDDVTAGRAYVQAYVRFVHYVEHIYEATRSGEQSHSRDAEGSEHAE